MSELSEVLESSASDSHSKPEYPFWVVGIGAFAGILESLEQFFAKADVGSHMAYVVVQHLSPTLRA
jgi:two-component system CheB/CheR fusion protein